MVPVVVVALELVLVEVDSMELEQVLVMDNMNYLADNMVLVEALAQVLVEVDSMELVLVVGMEQVLVMDNMNYLADNMVMELVEALVQVLVEVDSMELVLVAELEQVLVMDNMNYLADNMVMEPELELVVALAQVLVEASELALDNKNLNPVAVDNQAVVVCLADNYSSAADNMNCKDQLKLDLKSQYYLKNLKNNLFFYFLNENIFILNYQVNIMLGLQQT